VIEQGGQDGGIAHALEGVRRSAPPAACAHGRQRQRAAFLPIAMGRFTPSTGLPDTADRCSTWLRTKPPK